MKSNGFGLKRSSHRRGQWPELAARSQLPYRTTPLRGLQQHPPYFHDGSAAAVTHGEPMVQLKRVYDPVSRADGSRLLVERLWPRGLSKARLHLASWLKEVGPSTELRQWFNHDPLKWSQFRRRYFRELDSRP